MKKKLLLSSAIFATAVALSSCGGGGGSSPSQGSTGSQPQPQAQTVGKVLVLFQKGTSGTAGATYTYQVAELKDDGSYTLSPIANDSAVDYKLYQRWTFANGAILLQAEDGQVYFYDPSNNQIKSLGFQAFGFEPQNFFMASFGDYVAVRTGNNTFRAVDKNGNVSAQMTANLNRFEFNSKFIIATNSNNEDCVIKASNVSTVTPIAASAQISDSLHLRIVRMSNNNIFFINDDGDVVNLGITSAAALNGSTVNFKDYRIQKVGSDYYLLFRDATGWRYIKVSGTTVVRDTTNNHLLAALPAGTTAITDAALDADGKAFVLVDQYSGNANDDRVAVFDNPANYGNPSVTIADADTSARIFDSTAGVPARIAYLGKGQGIARKAGGADSPIAFVGATVPLMGSVVANFDTTIRGLIIRKDNEIVAADTTANTFDGTNDCKYINVSNPNNINSSNYNEQQMNNGAQFTFRGATSNGSYLDDGTNFYRLTVSPNACTRLSNVTVANTGVNAAVANTAQTSWIKASVSTRFANPLVPRDYRFFSSKFLAHSRGFDGNAIPVNMDLCEITDSAGNAIATNAPQAYVIDLDNDSRTIVGPSYRIGCFDNLGGNRLKADAVALKMPYIYDINKGVIMYGFNPLLNATCSGVERFDKLVVNIGNKSWEISKVQNGWCVVTGLGVLQ